MSLFRKVGKKFEETKRSLLEGNEPEYRCQSCEEPLTTDYETCPHCGADTVEAASEPGVEDK